MDKITVLLADDHHLVRRGFRRMLEDDPDLTVVGEASDGDEAVRMALSLSPRVVVMDCAMPGTSGLVATRRILETRPDIAILMLSMHAEQTLVSQALDSGRARIHPQERRGPRSRLGGQARRRRRDGARSDGDACRPRSRASAITA